MSSNGQSSPPHSPMSYAAKSLDLDSLPTSFQQLGLHDGATSPNSSTSSSSSSTSSSYNSKVRLLQVAVAVLGVVTLACIGCLLFVGTRYNNFVHTHTHTLAAAGCVCTHSNTPVCLLSTIAARNHKRCPKQQLHHRHPIQLLAGQTKHVSGNQPTTTTSTSLPHLSLAMPPHTPHPTRSHLPHRQQPTREAP